MSTMILACPSCGASFRIDAGKLGARGRSVRCSKCKHTWHASPDDGRAEAAPSADPARPEWAETAAAATASAESGPAERETAGPPPATGEGPEPGNERVLRTHASPDDSRTDLRASGVGEFETTLRASRYRPYDTPPEADGRGARGALVLGWLLLGLVVAGVLAGGWAFREQVVAQVPQAAQIYKLAGVEVPALGAGLELRDVTRTRRLVDGGSLLVIEGRVFNTTAESRRLPPLEVALFDAAGDEVARWRVQTDQRTLEAGQSAGFETRRENPPETAREFALSFAEPSDP